MTQVGSVSRTWKTLGWEMLVSDAQMSCIRYSGVKTPISTFVGGKPADLGDRVPCHTYDSYCPWCVCLGQQLLFNRESGDELRRQSKVQRKEGRG